MTCELDPPGDSNDLMYQIVTVSEIGGYQFFVPTDYYRHAESLSGCLTKRIARTYSGGGETVTRVLLVTVVIVDEVGLPAAVRPIRGNHVDSKWQTWEIFDHIWT